MRGMGTPVALSRETRPTHWLMNATSREKQSSTNIFFKNIVFLLIIIYTEDKNNSNKKEGDV